MGIELRPCVAPTASHGGCENDFRIRDLKGVAVTLLSDGIGPPSGEREARPTDEELQALANFRYALRQFLAFSEHAAAEVGLTTQRYQALLAIKTYRAGEHISVGELADQLMIKDHSAAELVSRLVQAKLVKRRTDPIDRRRSLVIMTAAGDRCLAQLASVHLRKLRESRGAFLNLFQAEEKQGR